MNPARPMHCLHYLGRVRRADGGVVTAVLDLCAALAEGGVGVTLLTKDATDVPSHWRASGPRLPRVIELPGLKPGGLNKPAWDQAKREVARADLLHLHTPWDLLNPPLAGLARSAGVPYAVTLHGMLDHWSVEQGRLKKLKKLLYLKLRAERMLRLAASVHCTAEAEREQASERVSGLRTHVLPCLTRVEWMLAIPRRPAPPPGGVPPGPMRLLFLSRLHPKKRPEVLIEALRWLPMVEATLAGPAEPKYAARLRTRAAAAGVAGRIDWPGIIAGEAKLSAYREADVFVLPTQQENFGIVLIEAMAAGLPVVTTKGVDLWKELEAAGALIVKPDPEAVAAAIRILMQDPAAAVERGLQGRRWVQEELVESSLLPRYHAWYRSLLEAA